ENIFVVCKTPMAVSITRRTLMGYRNKPVNAHSFNDLIEHIKEKPEQFCSTISKGFTFWHTNNDNNMKFNAIVGNPPYQVMDGGAKASAKPVYQHFVNIAKAIKPHYISMIMPAKWYTGGKGLDDFREEMLNDKRISYLADFDDSRACFPTADIAGGVCYFRWASHHEGLCHFESVKNESRCTRDRRLNEGDVFIRDLGALDIIYKVQALG
ncbi:MAG: Eco57I restriction-modification methylase domain-containing protein, partial [Treponema sp.]|nr:Eco57I restriction-modification methylase domain-containing protein [Treponema sp.]